MINLLHKIFDEFLNAIVVTYSNVICFKIFHIMTLGAEFRI